MNLSDSWAVSAPTNARMSAAEAVFADLRAAISSGKLPVGQKLPSEAALAARHSVSRSVIREALRSCHALGLTETKTGLGTFVVRDRVGGDIDIGMSGDIAMQELAGRGEDRGNVDKSDYSDIWPS